MNETIPESERAKILAQNLEKLSQYSDLEKPITDLATALRLGGNFSAHFQGEAEPTQETAEAMIDLVEFMLEYLFIVPGRTDDLANHIQDLQKGESL